jgi:hypothetical protein
LPLFHCDHSTFGHGCLGDHEGIGVSATLQHLLTFYKRVDSGELSNT